MAFAQTQMDAVLTMGDHVEAAGLATDAGRFAASAANATNRDAPQVAPHVVSGLKLQPGTMEAEMLEFLRRPGPHAPHIFTMDRLRYPPSSHEVNEDGKEQVFLLAKILLAYCSSGSSARALNRGWARDGTALNPQGALPWWKPSCLMCDTASRARSAVASGSICAKTSKILTSARPSEEFTRWIRG